MKILYVSHTKEKELTDGQMGWKNTPEMVRKRGHEVVFILRENQDQILIELTRFKPDVVVVFGMIGARIALWRKLGILKCPVVNEWNEDFKEMLQKKYWYLPLWFMEEFMIKNSDLITTGSPTRAKKAKQWGKKVWYCPYAADKHDVEPYPLESDRLKLLYVGEQSEKKRVREIVEAVAGLDCDLYLTDKPNPDLQLIATTNVHFLGRLPQQEDVFRLIKAVDVCVSTEDNDAPNKLFEYWQMGKPVLAPSGKMDSYECGVIATGDYKGQIQALINIRKQGRLDEFVKGYAFPVVPTWEEWVDLWLAEVTKLVK